VKAKLTLLGIVAVLVAVGCGAEQKMDESYLKNAPEVGKTRYEIQQKAKGDWNALTPEDKTAYVKTFNGDENQAKTYWENIKKGPPRGGPQ